MASLGSGRSGQCGLEGQWPYDLQGELPSSAIAGKHIRNIHMLYIIPYRASGAIRERVGGGLRPPADSQPSQPAASLHGLAMQM